MARITACAETRNGNLELDQSRRGGETEGGGGGELTSKWPELGHVIGRDATTELV